MATIRSEREEYLTRLENRIDELQTEFEGLMRAHTRDNEVETLTRVERAKKSIAEKGEALDAAVEAAREASDETWEEARRTLDAAWREYREAVERAELEFERAAELT